MPLSFHLGSSPHTRGAHRLLYYDTDSVRIIPAYAGSTGSTSAADASGADHPRIRGEHPVRGLLLSGDRGSSPHTRGAHRLYLSAPDRHRIIPAYAGSTSSAIMSSRVREDHPRIRGEHYVNSVYPALAAGSSPHTRGALRFRRVVLELLRIIPAYAGSTSARWSPKYPSGGSSPHTRGARRAGGAGPPGRRIIPAYAGSTKLSSPALAARADHPRIRGEHPPRLRRRHPKARIIPAYAGSTACTATCAPPHEDHPRIRGEHAK